MRGCEARSLAFALFVWREVSGNYRERGAELDALAVFVADGAVEI
jgi:hypothetical protein